MAVPTISNISPIKGGSEQWVYVDGEGFVEGLTQIFMITAADGTPSGPVGTQATRVKCYTWFRLGFYMPQGKTIGQSRIFVYNPGFVPTAQSVSSAWTDWTPNADPSTLKRIKRHSSYNTGAVYPRNRWVYVWEEDDSTTFIATYYDSGPAEGVTVRYKSGVTWFQVDPNEVLVYSPSSLGFPTKDASHVINEIYVNTPLGGDGAHLVPSSW